jgi:RNA polymerase sigma-70 factor (ECF subfamily)
MMALNTGASSEAREDIRLLRGSPADFGRFYERHEDYVLRTFLRAGASADVVADLTAETFARALQHRRSFNPHRGEPRGWLTGIARNVLNESLRAGRTADRVRRMLSVEPIDLDDATITRINELAGQQATDALKSLPAAQRLAIEGRVVHEEDYHVLASRLQCSESVVRKRVSRGIRAMRDRLEEERR